MDNYIAFDDNDDDTQKANHRDAMMMMPIDCPKTYSRKNILIQPFSFHTIC
jgi:hypothetical protein